MVSDLFFCLSFTHSLKHTPSLSLTHTNTFPNSHSLSPPPSLSGRGGANHKATIRLFDAPEGYEPLVTLYRDTAGWYVRTDITFFSFSLSFPLLQLTFAPLFCNVHILGVRTVRKYGSNSKVRKDYLLYSNFVSPSRVFLNCIVLLLP